MTTARALDPLSPSARQSVRPSIRFVEPDTYQGVISDPASLHKYLYADADPTNGRDPSGRFDLPDLMFVTFTIAVLASSEAIAYHHIFHPGPTGGSLHTGQFTLLYDNKFGRDGFQVQYTPGAPPPPGKHIVLVQAARSNVSSVDLLTTVFSSGGAKFDLYDYPHWMGINQASANGIPPVGYLESYYPGGINPARGATTYSYVDAPKGATTDDFSAAALLVDNGATTGTRAFTILDAVNFTFDESSGRTTSGGLGTGPGGGPIAPAAADPDEVWTIAQENWDARK
ncbi:MAG TPA: hypothetical protein VM008_16150 [Phycisphaerae bacterium]|nr:hypothetical protein [Phycisphaerae bacterium]